MRRLILALAVLVLAGCATVEPRPAPLTREDIVRLSKAGEPAAEIIRRLSDTRTVMLLSGSDIVRLHQDGVPQEVLDHLQRVQIEAIRRRDAFDRAFAWPYLTPFHCPWPPYGLYPRPFGGMGRWPYC
jgi:hypothetical protein